MQPATLNRPLSGATLRVLREYLPEVDDASLAASIRTVLARPLVGVLAKEWDVCEELYACCDTLKALADNRLNTEDALEDYIADRAAIRADLEYGAQS